MHVGVADSRLGRHASPTFILLGVSNPYQSPCLSRFVVQSHPLFSRRMRHAAHVDISLARDSGAYKSRCDA